MEILFIKSTIPVMKIQSHSMVNLLLSNLNDIYFISLRTLKAAWFFVILGDKISFNNTVLKIGIQNTLRSLFNYYLTSREFLHWKKDSSQVVRQEFI